MIDGSYICPSCGEEIVVPVDPLVGDEQDYVEDCPVCCRPNLLRVTILDAPFEPAGDWAGETGTSTIDDGEVRIVAEPE